MFFVKIQGIEAMFFVKNQSSEALIFVIFIIE